MTTGSVVAKLLRFKGLRVVNCWFEGRDRFVIAVKPYKNGRRCPECNRRCTVVRTMAVREWRDVRSAGEPCFSTTARVRSAVQPTVGAWRRFPGQNGTHA